MTPTAQRLDGNTFTVDAFPRSLSTNKAIALVKEEFGVEVNLAGWEIWVERGNGGGTISTRYTFVRRKQKRQEPTKPLSDLPNI